MKIRIKGNSIRLRLTRTEVEYFGRTGVLEEKTEFGDNAFSYSLVADGSYMQMHAELSGASVIIYMPSSMAKEWVESNTVGYSHDMDLAGNRKLYLLIEKDFKCLDNTIEDQSDNYPNPLAAANE